MQVDNFKQPKVCGKRAFDKEMLEPKLNYCYQMYLYNQRASTAKDMFPEQCTEQVIELGELLDEMMDKAKIYIDRGELLLTEGTSEYSPEDIKAYALGELKEYKAIVEHLIETDPDLPSAVTILSRQVKQCIETIPKVKNPTMP